MTNENEIPQVNAAVTDRNREQTRRICELKDAHYRNTGGPQFIEAEWKAADKTNHYAALPNGSFTRDQVVGMLEAEGAAWVTEGWVAWLPNKNYRVIWGAYSPFDLTATMDALIKVLEEKG